jgi:hypothetical protein
MNKSEFISSTSTGGLTRDDRKMLASCFDKDGNVKSNDFMEICLMALQSQTSDNIINLNNMIADAIQKFVKMRQWTNLTQLFRTLPDDIKMAARGDENFGKEIGEWADTLSKIIGMTSAQQKRAVELIELEEIINAT